MAWWKRCPSVATPEVDGTVVAPEAGNASPVIAEAGTTWATWSSVESVYQARFRSDSSAPTVITTSEIVAGTSAATGTRDSMSK